MCGKVDFFKAWTQVSNVQKLISYLQENKQHFCYKCQKVNDIYKDEYEKQLKPYETRLISVTMISRFIVFEKYSPWTSKQVVHIHYVAWKS
jgi:hypothetical protein